MLRPVTGFMTRRLASIDVRRQPSRHFGIDGLAGRLPGEDQVVAPSLAGDAGHVPAHRSGPGPALGDVAYAVAGVGVLVQFTRIGGAGAGEYKGGARSEGGRIGAERV